MLNDEILTMDDFELRGKTILLRCDLNSPVDPKTGKITDDSRIKAHGEATVKELAEIGAKVAVLSHQGDPLFLDQFISLEQHAQLLSKHSGVEVNYIDDIFGPAAREAIKNLENGQIILLENTRYFSEDTRLFEDTITRSPEDQAKCQFVQKLYPLADLFLLDAFAAAHKSQPSIVGFAEVLPAAAGRVMEAEVRALMKVRDNPEKPCVFFLGGRKISDKYEVINPVLKNKVADRILTSGVIGLLMLKAEGYELGKPSESLIQELKFEKYIPISKKLLDDYGDKIEYPSDFVVDKDGGKEVDITSLPVDAVIGDIGKKTIEKYAKILQNAKTIFFSGPPGIFEKKEFEAGTKDILKVISESRAFSVIGGGHSIAALSHYNILDKVSYSSTGGGALVRYLSGEELPAIKALKNAAKRYLKK
ncbi:MAG: phosphoglycerate kinase [Promethearchaeota archaeon]